MILFGFVSELNRTFFDFQVIPSVINGTNIKLEENGDGLILSWPAVTNCNWGAVLYDVSVKEGQREIYSKVTRGVPSLIACGCFISAQSRYPGGNLLVPRAKFAVAESAELLEFVG